MDPVYLDYNATTPVDPRVREAMLPWLGAADGNPSSSHAWGRRARRAVDEARARVAALLGCDAEEVVFTSGGSEANNHAIKGAAWARQDEGRHLIVSAVEHPAVLEPARWLAARGWTLSVLEVDGQGRVDPAAVAAALRHDTVLVSVMLANNETGVRQPVAELGRALAGHPAWLHTDAAQAVGKVPVKVRELGVDLLSLAGHKLYAPKGVGALYLRRGLRLEQLIHGAAHEAGRRAGTEAVAQVVALGEACRLAEEELRNEMTRQAILRNRLATGLRAVLPELVVHGEEAERLPNTLSLAVPGVPAPALLDRLGDLLAASAGAACHGSGGEVSGVLAAMGVPAEVAMGTVRLTVGRFTSEAEIEQAIALLARTVPGLRDEAG
jgi:cysteine desulfurase